MKIRDVTVAVMIRVLKFSERVVVRWTFYPRIVNADFLARPQVVIDDHASRTHDCHFTNFPRLEPAALDGCKALTREGERHVFKFSNPCVILAFPWQLTAVGNSSRICRMIEMSCGARSHATLMSFWNNPRLRRRQLM